MAYTLQLSREAVLDMRQAFHWYEEKRPGLGFDFLLATKAMFDQISRAPFMFQTASPEQSHIRRAVVQRFNYLIFYAVEGDEIWVFAVVSSRQNPETWKRRIE